MTEPIRVGVSACLLGQPVRYDGGHKRDLYVVDTLGCYFEFVPVCPEVECGLGVPREAMRLVGDPDAPRLMTIKTGVDLTERMRSFAVARAQALAEENLCGFIFKAKSSSSGFTRVKVYNDKGAPAERGVGLSPGLSSTAFRAFRLKTKAACTTTSCGKTSSNASLRSSAGATPWPATARPRLRPASSPSPAATSCCSWPTARSMPGKSGD